MAVMVANTKYPTLEKESERLSCDPTALTIKEKTANGVNMTIQLIIVIKTESSSLKNPIT